MSTEARLVSALKHVKMLPVTLKFLNFLRNDVWRIPLRELQGPKGIAIRIARVLVLSVRKFANDQCMLHASALTFYSLLSIVPVFAMVFGVAKGFGLDILLREKVLESSQGQQEIMIRVVEFSQNLLANTKVGIIAGIGLVILFWTVIQVLSNIEKSFNSIWGIQKGRSLGQKFTDYLALMLIAPVLFIIASSATVFLGTQVQLITEKVIILGAVGSLLLQWLKVFPFIIFVGLLTFLYIFLPNGKVRFQSAFVGGLVSGLIYQIVQWGYIYFQIGAASAGAVYGTFAALPLFLIWLQTSWIIVLYGAELSFAHQNEARYEFEQDCLEASEEFKTLLTLRIVQLCVEQFVRGDKALSTEEMGEKLEVPILIVRELLQRLVNANILSVVKGENERDLRYQPASDVHEMTICYVIEKMAKKGTQNIPVAETPELKKLRETLHVFEKTLEKIPENRLLMNLSNL